MARTQLEKNREWLEEKLEEYCNRPMTDSTAEHLSVYRGAFKAICMAEKGWNPAAVEAYAVETRTDKPTRTPELDGDTELERVFMQIPSDKPHMMALFNILSDHMDQLAIVHRKMHDNLMMKFREVARN